MNHKIYQLCLDNFAAFIGSVIHTYLDAHYKNPKMVTFLDMPDGKCYKLSYVEIDPHISIMAKEEAKYQALNQPTTEKANTKAFCSN